MPREQRAERPNVKRNVSDGPRLREPRERSGRLSGQDRNHHGKREEKIKSDQRARVEALASTPKTTPPRRGSQSDDPPTVVRLVPVGIASASTGLPQKTSTLISLSRVRIGTQRSKLLYILAQDLVSTLLFQLLMQENVES